MKRWEETTAAKNIAVDLRVLDNKPYTGKEYYAYSIVKELLNYGENYFLIGQFADSLFPGATHLQMDLPHSDVPLANRLLALRGYVSGIDLLFSPYYPIPERRTFKGVMTVHDIIALKFPEWFEHKAVYEFFNIHLRTSLKCADHIIVDSQSAKNDLADYYSVDENKVSTVYLASRMAYFDSYRDDGRDIDILSAFSVAEPYVLSVCTIEPRKNLLRTLKAFELLRERIGQGLKLVLSGGLGWNYGDLLAALHASRFAQDIITIGYVSDEDLPVIYRNCEVFVYPSLYEGFGLPVLEAMQCGAPVVTSNSSSLPEVAGDAALYCDPYSIESIAIAMEKVVTDSQLRKELVRRGQARARLFSWRETARQTRDVFLRCLEQ